ncbi:MAG: diguanylate cyclase, partial [Anaerolineales bacterium]
IGRMGGDEFVVLTVEATENGLSSLQARLQQNVDQHNRAAAPGHELSFSLGAIRIDLNSSTPMETWLSQADAAMYKHKLARKRPVMG